MTRHGYPDSVSRAVEAHYNPDIPADVARLGALASWDLWYGPITEPDDGEPWPGFSEACAVVSAWADEALPSTLYVDTDSETCLDANPYEDQANWETPEVDDEDDGDEEAEAPRWGQGETEAEYIGPEMSSVYGLERREVLGLLFDRELASGGYLDG